MEVENVRTEVGGISTNDREFRIEVSVITDVGGVRMKLGGFKIQVGVKMEIGSVRTEVEGSRIHERERERERERESCVLATIKLERLHMSSNLIRSFVLNYGNCLASKSRKTVGLS